MVRATKLALVAVAAIAMFSTACAAHSGYGYGAAVVVRTPPPAPMVLGVVGRPPGPGYVWTDGYWTWRNRWVWAPGAWVRPPHPHAVWAPGRWEPARNGYRWQEGRWRY
jgi:hypothetical protein